MTAVEFNSRFDSLHNLLFSFAIKLTRNQEDAKDLMQETAFRAYGNRDKFQMGTNFKAWLTTIMRNTFINNYRKNKKRKELEQPVDNFLFAIESTTIGNGAYSNMLIEELNTIINGISDAYSVPFRMFYLGYKYDEIADHLAIPIGTVKSRIHFARKKIKALIDSRY